MLTLENDGTIKLGDKTVGSHSFANGKHSVRLSLTYVSETDDWIVPLSWLDHGLAKIQPPRAPTVLTVPIGEDSVSIEENVPRLITEKKLKVAGYVWEFHKNDPDNWPSLLHGHDYEQGLKIDAITGDIFVVATKQKYATLKKKKLENLHQQIRSCSDLKSLADAHLPRGRN